MTFEEALIAVNKLGHKINDPIFDIMGRWCDAVCIYGCKISIHKIIEADVWELYINECWFPRECEEESVWRTQEYAPIWCPRLRILL